MNASTHPRDDPSGPKSGDTLSEPRVTLGALMVAAVVVPAVSLRYLGPESAAKILTAMIPLLLIAVFRTSITTYTIFETGPKGR
jgi:L-asparagine transporter-like permease